MQIARFPFARAGVSLYEAPARIIGVHFGREPFDEVLPRVSSDPMAFYHADPCLLPLLLAESRKDPDRMRRVTFGAVAGALAGASPGSRTTPP